MYQHVETLMSVPVQPFCVKSAFCNEAANIFLALETWGYLLSYIVGASMNISLLFVGTKNASAYLDSVVIGGHVGLGDKTHVGAFDSWDGATEISQSDLQFS